MAPMAKITHRIPWRTPYGWTEIVYESGEALDYPQLALDAVTMEDSYAALLPKQEIENVPERQYEDAPPEYGEPPREQRREPPRGSQRPQSATQRGSGFYCPNHPNVEVRESAPQYQTYDDVDGVQMPAKFYCPGASNGTGKNHSLWRSALLTRGASA